MLCAIWYHLYNLKNVKNTHGGVLLLVIQLQFFEQQNNIVLHFFSRIKDFFFKKKYYFKKTNQVLLSQLDKNSNFLIKFFLYDDWIQRLWLAVRPNFIKFGDLNFIKWDIFSSLVHKNIFGLIWQVVFKLDWLLILSRVGRVPYLSLNELVVN